MVPVVQRGGDVGLLEGGDEHQRGGRVDQPTPGALAGDDQSTRPEGGHVGAIVNEAGAHHREGLGLGRRGDREHLRRPGQRLSQVRGSGVAPGQQERSGQHRVGLPGPGRPPRTGSPGIARLPAEDLGDPHVRARDALHPDFEIEGVARADIGPPAVPPAGVAPACLLRPDAARHGDEGGGHGIDAARVPGPVPVVPLRLVTRGRTRPQLPAAEAAGNVGVADAGPDEAIPATLPHTHARWHGDLGHGGRGEDELPDDDRQRERRALVGAPHVEVAGGHQPGVRHRTILMAHADSSGHPAVRGSRSCHPRATEPAAHTLDSCARADWAPYVICPDGQGRTRRTAGTRLSHAALAYGQSARQYWHLLQTSTTTSPEDKPERRKVNRHAARQARLRNLQESILGATGRRVRTPRLPCVITWAG